MIAPFLAGLATGLRTMTPVAGIAATRHRPALSGILGIAALGELGVDKTAAAPRRDEAPGAIGRAISGTLAGAVIGRGRGRSLAGAALGLAGAVVATQAGVRLRIALAQRIGHDWPVALVEDAVAVALAAYATRRP
ncbi:DUF4126 domain-containing protein [Sphingomonas japonica]|uniref:Membrane protein n=1 Tax=Sphingomonas japonica TaxID=511662 RepID=A0ABX0TY66_9SPHN|nr:DUF4126 domain-containing protein [Sphingomonas japonica]NIJ23258.1 putative membrane protein [Sphingomonas japonica]